MKDRKLVASKRDALELNRMLVRTEGFHEAMIDDEPVLVGDLEINDDRLLADPAQSTNGLPIGCNDRKVYNDLYQRLRLDFCSFEYKNNIAKMEKLSIPPATIIAACLLFPVQDIERWLAVASDKHKTTEAGYFITMVQNRKPTFWPHTAEILHQAKGRQWGLYREGLRGFGTVVLSNGLPKAEEQAEPDANEL